MSRKYPFFTQIVYTAHFRNPMGPIYSPKKSCKQKTLRRGRPVELNLFVPFRIEKAHFSEKNSPDLKRIFTAEKKAVSVVLVTNE